MYGIVTVANDLGPQDMQDIEFFDPCLYRRSHGKIFRLILWLGYQSVRGLMQFG